MRFINSDALLSLLVKHRLITRKQQQFITLEKGKQRQKLLKKFGGGDGLDKTFPDLIDIILSFNFSLPASRSKPLTEEIIMRAVAKQYNLEFKKLDPLELDIDIVTKTIPKNFAINHLLVPFNVQDGVLEIATYHPDCQTAITDIEHANQVKIRPYTPTSPILKKSWRSFSDFRNRLLLLKTILAAPGSAHLLISATSNALLKLPPPRK